MKKRKHQKVLNFYFIFVFFSIIFNSCLHKKREIEELIHRYQSSVNHQNAEEFLSCFAEEYQDPFFPKALAPERIKKELSGPFLPSLEIAGATITVSGKEALVKHKYILRWVKGDQGQEARGEEELKLKKEKSGWKIVAGSEVYQYLSGRAEEEEEIKGLLQKRMRALAEKNLPLFKELIDPEYNFKGKDFSQVIAEMEDYFQTYDRIELILDKPRIRFVGEGAEVVESFQLKVWYQGEIREFNDLERLQFRKTTWGWKISKGL